MKSFAVILGIATLTVIAAEFPTIAPWARRDVNADLAISYPEPTALGVIAVGIAAIGRERKDR
ncbi:MAG: hypothetical protein SFX74_12255 [Fimbriimonadaceae bacterium]|nr:hypothetical protein [Fimbriimonadaceae bacterium]